MELGSDVIHALRQRVGGAETGEPAAALDWPGLRARLAAAHAARAALRMPGMAGSLVCGSFAPVAAANIAAADMATLDVNPFALADRKSWGANDLSFAGAASSGDARVLK